MTLGNEREQTQYIDIMTSSANSRVINQTTIGCSTQLALVASGCWNLAYPGDRRHLGSADWTDDMSADAKTVLTETGQKLNPSKYNLHFTEYHA